MKLCWDVTSFVLPISGVHFNGTKRQKCENEHTVTFVHLNLHFKTHENFVNAWNH